MALLRPFKAIKPKPEYCGDVAALPYDVMSSEEAREMIKDKPLSFLHIDRAETDLPPGTEIYSEQVYLKARENLDKLVSDGVCEQEEEPRFYIYSQTMNGRTQTGLVGCVSIDDYVNNVIKKHELTRADKEVDRIKHVSYCDANTGPIFLTYRPNESINAIVREWKAEKPVYCDFTTSDGVRNTVWVIDDDAAIRKISALFKNVKYLYIADGHHRAASAVDVGIKRRKLNRNYSGNEEFNFFLAVLFACDELEIMDYNRVIKDLNGLTVEEMIDKISVKFTVEKKGKPAYKPEAPHTFGMYVEGEWYKLTAKEGSFDEDDVIGSLDVSILQNNLISPVLGVTNPRVDRRIDYVGGIRGLGELERRAGSDMKIAFSMYPTSVEELMKIADNNLIMPPKSTWFEPKLLSGLFIHKLS